jgi:hypothetical protein
MWGRCMEECDTKVQKRGTSALVAMSSLVNLDGLTYCYHHPPRRNHRLDVVNGLHKEKGMGTPLISPVAETPSCGTESQVHEFDMGLK